MQMRHHAPRGFVGEAVAADFPRLHEFVQRGDGFGDGRQVGGVVEVVEAEGAEVVDAAFRPVQLVEVEVVGVQAGERGVAGGVNLRTGEARAAAYVVLAVVAARGAGDFAGEDDVIAFAAFGEPAADVLFGAGVGLAAGWHGVHFGGVDEVHAVCGGVVELGVGFGFRVLFAEGHGAEADGADADVGVAERTVFHGILLLGWVRALLYSCLCG